MNSRLTSRSLPDSPEFSGLAQPEVTAAAAFEGSQQTADLKSWKRRLAGAPALNLPTDHSRSSATGSRYAEGSLCINSQASAAIRQFAQRESSSVSTVLLGAFCALLYRYTSQDDLVVGCTLE